MDDRLREDLLRMDWRQFEALVASIPGASRYVGSSVVSPIERADQLCGAVGEATLREALAQ